MLVFRFSDTQNFRSETKEILFVVGRINSQPKFRNFETRWYSEHSPKDAKTKSHTTGEHIIDSYIIDTYIIDSYTSEDSQRLCLRVSLLFTSFIRMDCPIASSQPSRSDTIDHH